MFTEVYNTTNVKNMHPHRDSNPGSWITVTTVIEIKPVKVK